MSDEAIAEIGARSYLVVDDEPFVRKMLIDILERLGAVDVAGAANGVEALAHLDATQTPPDVMLIDLVMPEMGGVEMLRCLSERAYRGAVLLVSGADEETLNIAEGMARYRDLNLLGHLSKPVTPASLEAALSGSAAAD